MKNKLSFGHCFNLAWSDFTENFIELFCFLGLQLFIWIIISGFFYSALGFNQKIPSLSHDSYMFFSFIGFYALMITIYTCINRQNSLDVASKKIMSWMNLNNRIFTFIVGMFIYAGTVGFISKFVEIFVSKSDLLLFENPNTPILLVAPMIILMFVSFVLAIFLAQRWRFVGLYLLEDGSSILEAFKASWRMTCGHLWFFIRIFIMKWFFIGVIVLTTRSIGLAYIVVVFMIYLIDAHIYKHLRIKMDKDIALCDSCEN